MFHHLDFRVHCHATEDEEKVLLAFTFVSGVEKPEVTRAKGFHGNPITVFKASIKEAWAIRAFWDRVEEAGDLDAIVQSLERSIDRRCQLHLRFDKQEAYQGRIRVVEHGDVIALRGKVAAYPARRRRAIEAAQLYFQGG
ncbi:MAG: RNA-binding domain-containing protein [Thermoplasmata archaeon]